MWRTIKLKKMKTIQHSEFLQMSLKNKLCFIDLFKDVNTFKEFLTRIDNLSDQFLSFGYTDKWHMIGDLFEIFAELFFIILGVDNRVGIYDYSPVKKDNDNGVDGIGIGFNKLPATVQVKYRGDPTYELTSEDLKQFGFQSIVEYNVDKNTTTNMIIFTNAKNYLTLHSLFSV